MRPCRSMTPHRRDIETAFACLVISDEHNVHCLDESDLDTWWDSLDPTVKADVYEAALEGMTEYAEKELAYAAK